MKYDVAIVGNGILGYSVAYYLKKAAPNLKIAVIGPENRLGSASWAAGAMINVFAEVDRNTFHDQFNKYKFDLARRARDGWFDLNLMLSQDGIKPPLRFGGTTVVPGACDAENIGHIKHALDLFNVPGYVSASGSIFIPDEYHLDPRLLLDNMQTYFKANDVDILHGNVTRVTKQKIVHIQPGAGCWFDVYADKIVLAAGAATGQLLDSLELPHPKLFYGTGLGMLTTLSCPHPVGVVRTPVRAGTCGIVVIPQGKYVYVGSNTKVSDSPNNLCANWSTMAHIVNQVNKYAIPKFADNMLLNETVVGHRPVTEDSFPMVGETSIKGIFVLTGTRRDGLTMAPMYAKDMVDRLAGRPTIIKEWFHPERKPIRWLTTDEGVSQLWASIRQYNEEHDIKMNEGEAFDVAVSWYEKRNLDYGVLPELVDVL